MKGKTKVVVLMLIAAIVFSCTAFGAGFAEDASGSTILNIRKADVAVDGLKLAGEAVNVTQSELFGDDDLLWVMVRLDEGLVGLYLDGNVRGTFADYAKSKEGQMITEQMLDEQAAVLDLMNGKGIDYTISHRYTTLLNGMAVQIKHSQIDTLKAIAGVKNVYISEFYDVPETTYGTNGSISSAFDLNGMMSNETGYNGEGTVIAILDTGLDYEHSAFNSAISNPTINFENLSALTQSLYCTQLVGADNIAEYAYINEKVPFGFDYADMDNDVIPDIGAVWDYGGYHGTHVAGIAAGDDDQITAAASQAQLAIFKVFSDYSGGAYMTDIVAALGDVLVLGCDVANLSLGSAAGFTAEDPNAAAFINEIYDLIAQTGLIMCCSTGNDNPQDQSLLNLTSNPDNGIVGSPASYNGTLGIGSIDNAVLMLADFNGTDIYLVNAVDSDSKKYDFYSLLGEKTTAAFDFVALDAFGYEADYEGLDVTGKIVLIPRGEISFQEKQEIAAQMGAIACLVINTDENEIVNMVIGDLKIPTACVVLNENSLAMFEAATGSMTFDKSAMMLNISSYSSAGVLSDLTIGVDVVGVGGSVRSSINAWFDMINDTEGYVVMSGTSMSSPNVASTFAVLKGYLKQMYPEKSNIELRELCYQVMMSTAYAMTDADGNYVSPRYQGAGLVDVNNAVAAEAYLTVTGSDRVKLSLGDDEEKTGIYTLSFNLVNVSENAKTFDIKATAATALAANDRITAGTYAFEGFDVTYSAKNGVIEGNSITVEGGQTAKVKVVIVLSENNKAYLEENYVNGGYVEGYVVLAEADGIDLSIPYVAFYGDWEQAPIFEPTYFEYLEGAPVQGTVVDILAAMVLGSAGNITIITTYGLGRYYYATDFGVESPKGSEDYISLGYTGSVYCLSFGTLRNLDNMEIKIFDKYTGGEVICDYLVNIKKNFYSDGWTITEIEVSFSGLSPKTMGFMNNQSLILKINGSFNGVWSEDSIEFPIFIDMEAATLNSAELRTEEENTLLDIDVYDNHYLQCVGFYTSNGEGGLSALSDYAAPVYEFTPFTNNKLTLNITKYMDDIVDNTFAIGLIDYANNKSIYYIELPNEGEEVNAVTITEDYEISEDAIVHSFSNEEEMKSIFANAKVQSKLLKEKYSVNAEGEDEVEEFVVENGVLVAYNGEGGDVVIPGDLGITTIGQYCFFDTGHITSMVIPEGVTVIDSYAFFAAYSIKTISLPTTLEKVNDLGMYCMSQLTELDYSNTKVNYFGRMALGGNNYIKNLIIPDNGTVINVDGWQLMTALETLEFKCEVGIMRRALSGFVSLKTLDFDKNVNRITGVTLLGANKLTTITFHGNLNSFGDEDGWESTCPALTSITTVNFMGDVGSIAGVSFSKCPQLREVNFYGNLGSLGTKAFGHSDKLTSFNVMPGNEYLVKDDYGIVYDKAMTTTFVPSSWDYDGEVIIPDTVTNLRLGESGMAIDSISISYQCDDFGNAFTGSFAFSSYTTSDKPLLKKLTLPEGITELPYNALRNFVNLGEANLGNITSFGQESLYRTGFTSLIFGDKVEYIGAQAWFGCAKLTELVFDVTKYDVAELGYYGLYGGLESMTEIVVPEEIGASERGLFVESTGLQKITFLNTSATSLGSSIFNGCSSLTEVIGIEGIATVGSAAFYRCSSLKSIDLPNLVQIADVGFASCSSLEYVNYGDKLASVGYNAFYRCVSLKEIYVTQYMSSVDFDNVYIDCNALENIRVNENNPYFASIDGALYNKAVTRLIKYPSLKTDDSYEIPETVKSVGSYVFAGAIYLKEVTMLGVIGVNSYAFDGSALEIAYVRDLKEIDYFAFYNCNLKQIDLSNVTYIGGCAFKGCDLSEVVINEVAWIGVGVFDGNVNLEKVTLNNTFRFDFSMTFGGCTGIKEVVLGDNCTAFVIEGDMLMSADKDVLYKYFGTAEELTIPEGIVKVGAISFVNNTTLTKVTFPTTLKVIGDKAFFGATKLTAYEFLGTNAPILECDYVEGQSYMYANFCDYIFNDISLTVYHPVSNSYETVIWNLYFDTHYEMTEEGYVQIENIAVLQVRALIDTLSKLSGETYEKAVAKARAAYNTLSVKEQAEVSNYNLLLVAEQTISNTEDKDEETSMSQNNGESDSALSCATVGGNGGSFGTGAAMLLLCLGFAAVLLKKRVGANK
ncbi:MAG: leucine-rich repeat protein [Clostridia bacterium]|nr:leucine-rich repeat protein [Clostridia bacterium]